MVWSLGEWEDDPCRGGRWLVVEPDATVHMCLEIAKTGETTLTDIGLESGELRLRLNELTIIEGDTRELESGDRLVVSATEALVDGRLAGRVAARGVSIISSVTATPIDDRGDRLADVMDETAVVLIADEDDSLPGFADAVGGGFAAILLLGSVLLVGVGVALPFVPLVAAVAFVIIWTRRRRERREDEREDG